MGEVSHGITLLGVDKMRELGWVSQKEDGCVVGHNVPVALVSSHLDREPTRVTGAIVRARFATNGAKSNRDRALLAFGTEDVGAGEIIKRICAFEMSVSARTFRMDHSFWDSLAVKM